MSQALEELRALLAALPPAPDPRTLARVGAAFAALGPADVDLEVHAAPLRGPAREWWSVHLVRTPRAQLSLLLLPAGTVIPLHDHPNMHVWTRALRGRVRVESWDWLGPPAPPEAAARHTGERWLEPGETTLAADPLRGNLHRLECPTPSVLLDLFAPPYDETAGRPCRYWAPVAPPGPDGACRLRFLRQA